MPFPDVLDVLDFQNRLIVDELSYDRDDMARKHYTLMELLTREQNNVYNEIMVAVLSGSGGFFCYMVMVVLERHFFGKLYLQVYVPKE